MSTDAAFEILTDRRPCGGGTLVVGRYADGEIVSQSIVGSDASVYAIRPGSARALAVLLDRLGDVVPYAALSAGPPDSLRRDVGLLRAPLEACGLDVDVVRYFGYRLRPSDDTLIGTLVIGDVRVDVAGCRIASRQRTVTVGATTMAVLTALADERPRDAARLYRDAWGGVPHDVVGVVVARVAALRRALDEVGSRTRVETRTLHTGARRTSYYSLRTPTMTVKRPRSVRTSAPPPTNREPEQLRLPYPAPAQMVCATSRGHGLDQTCDPSDQTT